MEPKGTALPCRARLFSSLILVLTLGLTALSVPANAETPLSPRERTEIFERVWNLINERYYDPGLNGVDWTAQKTKYRPLAETAGTNTEFYDVIKRMVGEMDDAHTRFLTPREASERRRRKNTTVGLLLSRVEGRTVVERVRPDASGELARVRPGMIVRTVDGVPVAEKLAEAELAVGDSSSNRALEIIAYRHVLRGEPGTSVRLGLTDRTGRGHEVTLVRETIDETSEAIARKLPSGVGYIVVTSFKAPIAEKFRRALTELRDTPALIIDLRYNGGGSISEVLRMAGYLMDDEYAFGQYVRRSERSGQELREFTVGAPGGQVYANPVYILTSKFSASGSELFANGLQELGRASVIGSRTCGCLLGISRRHQIRGGGELHVSDIGFLSPKGRVVERTGVTPDIFVEPRISDLRSGFDRGIDAAEKMYEETAVMVNGEQ